MTPGTPSLHQHVPRTEAEARNDRALRIARDGLQRSIDAMSHFEGKAVARDALRDIIRILSGDA